MIKFTAEIDKELYDLSGCYIMTCDLQQKESKQVETVNGQLTLYTPQKYNNNHRTAHPNIGTVVQTIGDCEFNVGDELMCKHFVFEKEDKTPNHFYEENGVKYYKVYNMDVMYKITADSLICRKFILLCKPIYDKLLNTFLEVSGAMEDYRRDVAEVIGVWDCCEDYKVGEYVLLEKGGDYHFSHKGQDYVKCDHSFDDIVAVIDSPKWRTSEVLTHAKGHSERTDKTI